MYKLRRGIVALALSWCVLAAAQNDSNYALRQITIKNRLVYSDALRKLIPIKDGDHFDPELLRVGIDRIRYGYQEMGYILVACTPELLRDNEKRTISVVVSITEGKQFVIRSVTILGRNESDVRKELALLSLERGRIYNERLAELFVKRTAPATLRNFPPRSRINLATDDQGTVAVTFDLRDGAK